MRSWVILWRLALAILAALVLGIVVASLLNSLSENKDDLFWAFSRGMVGVVTTTIAGVIATAVFKIIDDRRARDRERRRVFGEIVRTYNRVKAGRRRLKAFGLIVPQRRPRPLLAGEVDELRSIMASLNDAQLDFEALRREVDESDLFRRRDEIAHYLRLVEHFINKCVLDRWEKLGIHVREHADRRQCDRLGLYYFDASFRRNLRTPLDELTKVLHEELFGSRRVKTSGRLPIALFHRGRDDIEVRRDRVEARRKSFAARVRRRSNLAGYWWVWNSPPPAGFMASFHCDYIALDAQRRPYSDSDLRNTLAAIHAGDRAVGLVRVNDTAQIVRALNAGAAGVMVPLVNTAGDAHAAVTAADDFRNNRLPHAGRGTSPPRVESNDAVVVIAVIETPEGFANVEAIAAVPGLDGLYIGPANLTLGAARSADPGVATAFASDLQRSRRACRANGLAIGLDAFVGDDTSMRFSEGFTLVTSPEARHSEGHHGPPANAGHGER